MVERLWVPFTQRFVARNWNLAMSLLALTAPRVAKRPAVSTPLRVGLSIVVIACAPCVVWRLWAVPVRRSALARRRREPRGEHRRASRFHARIRRARAGGPRRFPAVTVTDAGSPRFRDGP